MEIVSHLLTSESLISLFTLTLLEVVLGIDNIVFISILSGKLDDSKRKKATNLGLFIAVIPRVMLLFALSWIISLKEPLFAVDILGLHFGPSGKDLILLIGGLFLLYKAVSEIHHKLEGAQETVGKAKSASFLGVIIQISLLNIVFSLDSILTAVGLVDSSKPESLWIMILAVIFSMIIMILFAEPVNKFVAKHPTIKMMALAFLMMIGTLLIMEGFHKEVDKGYVYFSMAFALGVELLNLRMKKAGKKVKLHSKYVEEIDLDEQLLVNKEKFTKKP